MLYARHRCCRRTLVQMVNKLLQLISTALGLTLNLRQVNIVGGIRTFASLVTHTSI